MGLQQGKRVAIVIGALALMLTICAYSIPRDFRYEKSVDIVAQQRMIFVFVGELRRWVEWTKWAARHPNAKYEYSSPSWGMGATIKWSTWITSTEAKVTQFTPYRSMAYDMSLGRSTPSQWQFHLGPGTRQGSTVKWTVSGQYPEHRFWRLVDYILTWRLSGDMERGLKRLKKHAELHEAYDVKGGWES